MSEGVTHLHFGRRSPWRYAAYALLGSYCLIVLVPIYTMLMTSVKTNVEVFSRPFLPPTRFVLSGYARILGEEGFTRFFANSAYVTLLAIAIILVLTAPASHALGRYVFKGRGWLYAYLLAGILIPIRLATISLIHVMNWTGLYDRLFGLTLIYVAMGIPFSIFILTEFVRQLPEELYAAARIDGAGEFAALWSISLPLLRPAIAATAIFNFVPIWNDFWWPLIFIRTDALKTVPLAAAIFWGQFETQWNLVFSALSLASLPALVFYLLMSRHFIKALTAGAFK